MGLPYPAAEFGGPPRMLRGRRRGRGERRWLAQRWTNRMVAMFSWMELGPEAYQRGPGLQRRGLSRQQASYANGLCEELVAFFRRPPLLGDGRSGSHRIDMLLQQVASGYGQGDVLEKLLAAAKEVDPTRVSFPACAGQFHPESVLEEPHRSKYLDASFKVLPPDGWGPEA